MSTGRVRAAGLAAVVVLMLTLAGTASSAWGAPPEIREMSNHVGPEVGGLSVEISGNHLTPATAVEFGGVPAEKVFVVNVDSLAAYAPPGTGVVDVRVTTAEGTSAIVPADRFEYRATPEFGTCGRVGIENGKFTKSTCVREEPNGLGKDLYEWYRGFEGPQTLKLLGVSFSAPTGLKLETAAKNKITCSAGAGAGEITGPTSIGFGALTFTGCESNLNKMTAACQGTGLGAGEIETNPLDGQTGITKLADLPEKYVAGTEFAAEGGAALAEFSCGGTPVKIRGSVILEMKKPNKGVEAIGWKAAAKKGAQKTKSFVGGLEAALEVKVGEGSYEPIGLTIGASSSTEEKIEFNTVV
ncbi:MAG TPA: IPT/TIG domain-containing protein [Solirubrobacteraceae bacterium]|nr:IPT/TIG domain-containing protein [Solirubrobacteraceae bacterium]